MPTGVYERTPEMIAARVAKSNATRAAKKAGKPAGKRDYKAEWAKRKAGSSAKKSKPGKPGSPPWTPARRKKFIATMKQKRIEREAAKLSGAGYDTAPRISARKAAKLALLNGPVRQSIPAGGKGLPKEVHVLEADGTLASYVLTTVTAYVRRP